MAIKHHKTKSRAARKQAAQGASPALRASPAPAAMADAVERAIESGRAQLLEAQAVLRCLYAALLYAEGEDALYYADVASVAGKLIAQVAERLDLVELRSLVEARAHKHSGRVAELALPCTATELIPNRPLCLLDLAAECEVP